MATFGHKNGHNCIKIGKKKCPPSFHNIIKTSYFDQKVRCHQKRHCPKSMHMLWISTLWGGWWAVRQDVLQERAKSYKFFWHQIIWKYWEKVDPAKTKAERQQEFGDRRRYEGGGQQKTLPENWQKVEIAKIRQQVFWGAELWWEDRGEGQQVRRDIAGSNRNTEWLDLLCAQQIQIQLGIHLRIPKCFWT